MNLSKFRAATLVVFVGGIAGMIVGSIADNNGTAITFGVITAIAALCLLVATAAQNPPQVTFNEATARRLEAQIQGLVAEGADEKRVRDLVRESVELGRSARDSLP